MSDPSGKLSFSVQARRRDAHGSEAVDVLDERSLPELAAFLRERLELT